MYRERLGNFWASLACPHQLVSDSGLLTVYLDIFSMADLKLLKKVHLLPKLSLATRLKEYYDWEEHMEDFFWGRRLASALKMYYAEETMAKDILHWWDRWDKKFPCWTWSVMKAVLRRRFRSLESKKVATARAQNPQGTMTIEPKEELIVQERDVSVRAEFFSTPEQQAMDSSFYSPIEPSIDIVDDAASGLSMLAQEVKQDGTASNVKGQRSNIFQSECTIHDKICKLIIDGGSFTDVISSDVVHALSLSTWRLPTPRYMQWMNQSGTLKITHKARVKISVGTYINTVDCDVAPLTACHLLLGRPWQFDLDATHGGRSNTYLFVHKGVNHVFKPIPESAIKAEVFTTSKMKKKVAEITPKPRTALLQEGENTVNTSAKGTANNFSEIIIKPMVALALEGENDIVCEATCNGSEIAKAALNKSSMQFGEHDMVVASPNNESFNEISRPRTILFHEGVHSVGSPNMAYRDLCNDLNILAGSHAKQFGSRGNEKADENNLVDAIQCKHISLGQPKKKGPEFVSKPRTVLFQEGGFQNTFDAQDTHENISTPRMVLFKEREDDEPMASQSIFAKKYSPISNRVIGLQFGAIIFDEKYSENLDKFTCVGLSSHIFFRGALLFGKEENKDNKQICLYRDHARGDKGLPNQTSTLFGN